MKLILWLLIVFLAVPLGAQEQTELAAEPRSPADMSVEERMSMMSGASKYDNCIYAQAISRVKDFADIRHTADFAMSECHGKLIDLEKLIVEMGFGAGYANAFSKRIRNRAARKILPELAIRQSGG